MTEPASNKFEADPRCRVCFSETKEQEKFKGLFVCIECGELHLTDEGARLFDNALERAWWRKQQRLN